LPGRDALTATDSGPSLTSRSLPGAQVGADGSATERGGLVQEWAQWLTDGWAWDWFFTGTFGDPDEPERLRGHTSVGWATSDRRFREWADGLDARLGRSGSAYWFRARELHKHRTTTHFHALVGGVGNLSRRQAWRDWFDRNGRARIEPINSRDAVSVYVAKYVLKDEGDYQFSPSAGLYRRKDAGDGERNVGRGEDGGAVAPW